jgi:hypothetical protein
MAKCDQTNELYNSRKIYENNDREINNLLDELDYMNDAKRNDTEDENLPKLNMGAPLDMTDVTGVPIMANSANNLLDQNFVAQNTQNLRDLNYYSGEGLNCAYKMELPRDFSNLNELYNLVGCNGDTRLASLMKFQSQKNKRAIDNRAAFDRTSAQQYFTDELNIEEKRIWWENPDVYDSVM